MIKGRLILGPEKAGKEARQKGGHPGTRLISSPPSRGMRWRRGGSVGALDLPQPADV